MENQRSYLLRQIALLQGILNMRNRPKKLTPLLQRKSEQLIAQMKNKGYDVMVFQGFRSFAEQDYLYAQGRTRPGAIVTNARGGDSFHNYGVAFDCVFMVNGHPSWSNNHPWTLLGTEGEKLGLEWGGRWTSFPDRPHFQDTKGFTLQDFKNNKVNYKIYV